MIVTYFDLYHMSGYKELFICDHHVNLIRRWQVEIGQGKSIQCLKNI